MTSREIYNNWVKDTLDLHTDKVISRDVLLAIINTAAHTSRIAYEMDKEGVDK